MSINSQSILYSHDANDEMYTPTYAVEPILKYIPEGTRVWCPFDLGGNSEFFKLIRKQNSCLATHIATGQDFYTYEPKEWDILISNPPYTNKRKIFERALSFGKPFALLMSLTWLNDAAPKQLFMEKDLQLLMFDKRIRFLSPDGRDNDRITFSSGYYCWNFLPKQIIMEELRIK